MAIPGPIQRRLTLHNDWRYDIPLKFLWGVFIYPRSGSLRTLGDNISRVIGKYEAPNSFNHWPVNVNCLDEISDERGEFGILLAQGAALPQDAFDVSETELEGTGGLLATPYGNRRSSYGGSNKLDLTFLETNIDIFDYFIRPWIIASSYKGMIEDDESDEDLKCGITIVLYSRDYSTYQNVFSTGMRGPKIRKIYQFYDAVPFQIRGDEMSYGDLNASEIQKTVSFSFTRYDIINKFDIPINNGV